MAKLPVATRYVQAWHDYGPFRTRPLGVGIHMAEGGGTVGYLDKTGTEPPRGVSVHFVVEYSGDIVQMLDIGHACGGLNPADRSTDKGFYGPDILRGVLGIYWSDPNAVSIQMEIEGFAATGPNEKQIAAVVKLVRALREAIPTLRGSFGHADQTDTKRCPGTTLAMRILFSHIGGHGVWSDMIIPLAINSTVPKLVDAPTGTRYDIDGRTVVKTDSGAFVGRPSPYGVENGMRAVIIGVDGVSRVCLVRATAVHDVPLPTAVPDPATLTAAFNAGVSAASVAAATARKV